MPGERSTLTIYIPDLVWAELKKQAVLSDQDASDVFGTYLREWLAGNRFALGKKSKKGALGPGRNRSLMLAPARLEALRGAAQEAGLSVSLFVRKLLIHGIPVIRPAYQVSHAHPYSDRRAYFEDDGISAWLYLSGAASNRVEAAGWAYNRIPAPSEQELQSYRSRKQVPVGFEYAAEQAEQTLYLDSELRFAWNFGGDAAALLVDDMPLVFVLAGQPRGYSRYLTKSGPWGEPFDPALFAKTFPNIKI